MTRFAAFFPRPARHALCLLVGLPLFAFAQALPPPSMDDGPYVFRNGQRLESLWVCAGKVVRKESRARAGARIAPRCGYPHPLAIPAQFEEAEAPLSAGARIVALSDIHGQYELMRRLLRSNGVIDANDRWNLGHDHLVVAGDVFDRGPNVTEAFWLLFQLQQQAARAGGGVHFVIGNHETMALAGDLRYVNAKYAEVARLLDRPYPALYAPETVIGGWLRTRPALLRLGDTLFLHGGIAPQNLELAAALDATNAGYRRSLGMPRDAVKADPAISRLYDRDSPVWYRGYFNGQLSTPEVAALVDRLGLARIVVGHTTMGEVASFHDGRVIAIDSAIKRGKSGQLLFIEGDRLSRGLLDGTRQPLPALLEAPEDKE